MLIFLISQKYKKWYDGYHFGDVDVYCPWDVMNYVLDLQRKPDAKPLSYWKILVIMQLSDHLSIMREAVLLKSLRRFFPEDI